MEGKCCFIKIKNQDNLCCARALVVAKAKEDNDPRWSAIRQGEAVCSALQKKLAEGLMRDAGLKNHQEGCGIEELHELQKALPDYQIKVHSKDLFGAIYFQGPPAVKILHLYYYDVITSMSAFLNRTNYCKACNKGYDHQEWHLCKAKCSDCLFPGKCQNTKKSYCQDCNRYFMSDLCYQQHKQDWSGEGKKEKKIVPTCEKVRRCKECGRIFDKYKERG